jgi:hypothetical protein
MRVNEVLARVDEDEIIMIDTETFRIQCTKNQLVHDDNFINMKLKDKIVTHLGVNHFSGGNGILIRCI